MDDLGADPASRALSIQERLYPDLTCFGCGPANPRGLRLRSYPAGGAVVATFRPWPEHDNGAGFLNGGIIATVLDCHGGAAVFEQAARRGATNGTADRTEDRLFYVTAGISVRYVRPCPLHEMLDLSAVVTSATLDEVTVDVELGFDGKQRATATAVWRRWRPRN